MTKQEISELMAQCEKCRRKAAKLTTDMFVLWVRLYALRQEAK